MKEKIRGIVGFILLFLLIVGMLVPASAEDAPNPEATIDPKTVSPALFHLAARTDMAVATMCGNEYSFSEDVFARALNLSGVDYITVASLPEVTRGELLIGSTRVSAGQVISAANLRMLTYVAAKPEEAGEASFTFSPNGAAYPITCRVYLLEKLNYSPTTSIASAEALSVSTHRDFAGYGTLTAYDPEGDAMTFEIVSRPEHGLVVLTDAANGEYVYLPRLGYTGTDQFRYVARDCYGNYSAAAEVSVRVSAPSVSVVYADMEGRADYNAALWMTEAGIMCGNGPDADGKMTFCPDAEVSRVEFLTMAMQTIGVGSVPTVADTGFADDAEIPGEAKGYVSAAYSAGYIKGEADENGNLCFKPNESISRAEAAVLLRNMLKVDALSLTPAFADASQIPVWATEAISTLSGMGILTASGGEISPCASVTRGQAAEMLSAMRRVTD